MASIVLFTFVALFPSLKNGFVNWDDPAMVTENPRIRNISRENVKWMFTTFINGHYLPMTLLSFSLDYVLWGLNPLGYHLTNLLIHIANAVILYCLALFLFDLTRKNMRIKGRKPFMVCAGLSALLFSVHPLRVESVAWVTERRDVLSALFYLLSVLAYLKAQSYSANPIKYKGLMAGAVLSLLISLLSKAWGVSVPLILLILAIYPLRRLGTKETGWFSRKTWKVWVEKVPFFILAIGAMLIAPLAQKAASAAFSFKEYGIPLRLAQAFYGITFYLKKSLVPVKLVPMYEIPQPFNPLEFRFISSAVLVVIITGLLILFRRKWPSGLAVWTSYIIIVAPVLGLFQSGIQLVADRYSYLACMGWAVLLGGGILSLWQKSRRQRIYRPVLSSILLLMILWLTVLGVLTWQQAGRWKNSLTLWKYTSTADPENIMAHYNIACIFMEENQDKEAIRYYRKVVRLFPAHVKALNNLGTLLKDQGKYKEAIRYYKRALRYNPNVPGIYTNLAQAYEKQGDIEAAAGYYKRALSLTRDPLIYNGLGEMLLRHNETEKAIEVYREFVAAMPDNVQAHHTLGILLARQGKLVEAAFHHRKVLKIQPGHAEANNNLANVLARQGKIGEAVQYYRRAIKADPNFTNAYVNLGVVLLWQGEIEEAGKWFNKALEIDPENRTARENLNRIGNLKKREKH